MKLRSIYVVLAAALAVLPACSGGGETVPDGADAGGDATPDASVDAGDDAGMDVGDDAGADAGDDGGVDAGWDAGTPPDHDPEESFLLTVPPGSELCTTFCEGRTWQEEYRMSGRIELEPGMYVLPRVESPLGYAFVREVVFGPDRVPAQAAGPGSFEVAYYYGAWQYVYHQDFTLLGDPYQVEVWVWFEPSYWGLDWPAEVTLEGEFAGSWVWARTIIRTGDGYCDERQTFAFHDLSANPGVIHRGATADGDRVLADVRFAPACMVAGNTACDEIDGAEVELDGAVRAVADAYRLFYSAGHHNLDQRYLILLDQPVGAAAAVLVETPPLGSTEGGALVRLDADLAEIGREPFVGWEDTYTRRR